MTAPIESVELRFPDNDGMPRAAPTPVFSALILNWSGWGPATSKAVIKRPIRILSGASGVLNFNDVGTWQATFNVREAGELPGKGDYMLFTYGADTLVSGPITERTLANGASPRSMVCTVKGYSEEIALKDRTVYPDPTRWAEAQTTVSHDRRSGTASTVLIGYARDHTSAGDAVWGTFTRDFSKLTMAPDPVIGPSISMTERYSNLLDCLQRAALKSGLGFRVVRRRNAPPTFEVTQPRDRSASVVFGPTRNNIESFEWTWEAPTVTSVDAAGTGELTARKMAHDEDLDATYLWRRHIELFRDQRSEDSVTQMHSDNLAALADGAATDSVRVKAIASPASTYGTQWRLGDLVRVLIKDPLGFDTLLDKVDRVQQVGWKATPAGVTFQPVIGAGGATDLTGAASRALNKRLTQIEGSQ